MADIERIVKAEDFDGKLPAFTSIGGYPIVYMTEQGNDLCADCTTKSWGNEGNCDRPISGDVYWEGPPLSCDECGKAIESAYGDPDA